MKHFYLAFIFLLSYTINLGQENKNQMLIKDFEESAQNNLSFQNGLFITITKPRNNHDALKKGFAKMQADNERAGGWIILESQIIKVDSENYTAILYEYKRKKYIALHSEITEGEYFFRIYDPASYIQK